MPLLKSDLLKHKIFIDEQDKHYLDEYSIFINYYGYITCDKTEKGIRKRIMLHQLIIGYAPIGLVVDHKNRNRLDNRRENLHFVSRSYNSTNKDKRKDSMQLYKGIQKLPSGKYSAKTTGGKRLGTFSTAKEAYNTYKEYIDNKYKEYPSCVEII